MSQETLINKIDTNIQPDHHQFLHVLYGSAPENLYLELRCIHPGTGEVRTLWTHLNQPESVLMQAQKLNNEGFGLYFALCLRKEQKGNAASAILLPALWVDIDCDNDPQKREMGMSRLCSFEPKPSVIVDSGGGWHGYWLLDDPVHLDEDNKQKISRIMQGLFAALDGDESYVKSVASVMRLPGSINTKPNRDGAEVKIIEWHPDRHYALSDFEWLEVQPKPQNSYVSAIPTNDNGHHPLPLRTESYLTSGAANGNRNHELFAAACQMRDAGYSQSDAERELIARHVADSNGTENSASREKEAQATIASVYSQSPREPIASPKQHAKQVVQQLVGQYEVEQKPERPTTEQIAEAVEACVHLNPIEWAEQREKFKSLTGEGLKISDIDRLYKEKKKTVERQLQQEYIDTESYMLLDGKIVYRKETYRGVSERTVTDWSATALYQTCQVDDDGKENHVTTIELHRGLSTKKLEVSGEIFVDDVALRRFIGASAGAQYVVRAGMSKHLVPAIVQLSGEFPTHRHYNFMGWKQIDDRWVYMSPNDCITSSGKLAEPPSVELDQRLRDYGLQATSWKDSLEAFDAVTKVLPQNLAPALISFAMLPLVQRFFPSIATRPAIHLVGTSGSGKSEIASLLTSFYGEFSRDTPPSQWSDTINAVEMMGYPLADALYWVDDYKDIYADTRTFVRFLQAYSRNLGRGRLTREAKLQTSKPCRGLILSTGETSLEGEMSVSFRMMPLQIPPWKQRDPQGQALAKAESLRDKLPGFTAHFASWVAKQLGENNLIEYIKSRFQSNLDKYQEKVTATQGNRSTHDRVVKNWAVLITVFQLLSKFIAAMDDDYLLPSWKDCIEEMLNLVHKESAGEVFLNVLSQIVGSGQAIIDENMRNPHEYAPGTTVIGYRHEGFVYLLPDVALREVNKVHPLQFGAFAIGSHLKEEGILIPGNKNLTVQKSVRGSVIRLWRNELPRSKLRGIKTIVVAEHVA